MASAVPRSTLRAPRRWRARAWIAAVPVLLLIAYAVAYDQGQLLQPVLGKAATGANYLHELFHDGRHLLGQPCH